MRENDGEGAELHEVDGWMVGGTDHLNGRNYHRRTVNNNEEGTGKEVQINRIVLSELYFCKNSTSPIHLLLFPDWLTDRPNHLFRLDASHPLSVNKLAHFHRRPVHVVLLPNGDLNSRKMDCKRMRGTKIPVHWVADGTGSLFGPLSWRGNAQMSSLLRCLVSGWFGWSRPHNPLRAIPWPLARWIFEQVKGKIILLPNLLRYCQF